MKLNMRWPHVRRKRLNLIGKLLCLIVRKSKINLNLQVKFLTGHVREKCQNKCEEKCEDNCEETENNRKRCLVGMSSFGMFG